MTRLGDEEKVNGIRVRCADRWIVRARAELIRSAMARPVSQKMGIKPGIRAFFVNAPETAQKAIELPELEVGEKLEGEFDYIHLFLTTRSEMDETFSRLKAHLRQGGMLWVSWPKGRKMGTDLSLPKVIEIGYSHGLVESTSPLAIERRHVVPAD